MKNSTLTILKSLAAVLGVALIAGIIVVVFKFTSGFTEDFKTFYIEYDGKQILTEKTQMKFTADSKPTFTVKYTFDGDEIKHDYSVKIIPNPSVEFTYSISGELYSYSKIKDLSAAFGIEKDSNSFSISLNRYMNIQYILKSVTKSSELSVPETAESAVYPYLLVVSSYDEAVTYNIAFGITGVDDVIYPTPVGNNGIILDRTNIVF